MVKYIYRWENYMNKEIVDKVLDFCGYTGNEIARKKHGSFNGCSTREFITTLLRYESGKDFVQAEGWGEQTFNRVVANILIPVYGKLNGGNETWKRVLLFSIGYKYCGNCAGILPYELFSIDIHNVPTGRNRLCKECQSVHNKEWYKDNKDHYHTKYIQEHLSDYRCRNAKRRADILKATPMWANLEKIKEIYNTCPEGYHVDHIIPLKNDLVCGLHVESNLQHLTASDNLAKSNKFNGGLA